MNHESEAIVLLRCWVAGCGDKDFSSKEEIDELIKISGEFLAKFPPLDKKPVCGDLLKKYGISDLRDLIWWLEDHEF